MTNYRAQYKLSQDAVRKYADDVRRLEKEIKAKDTIIKNLKKVVGEINREEKEKGSHQSKGPLSEYRYEAELVYDKKRVGIEDMKKDMLKMMDKNEINNLNDMIKATPEYKLGKSIIEDAKNKGEA
jgi:hypothetical protein